MIQIYLFEIYIINNYFQVLIYRELLINKVLNFPFNSTKNISILTVEVVFIRLLFMFVYFYSLYAIYITFDW